MIFFTFIYLLLFFGYSLCSYLHSLEVDLENKKSELRRLEHEYRSNCYRVDCSQKSGSTQKSRPDYSVTSINNKIFQLKQEILKMEKEIANKKTAMKNIRDRKQS